MSRDDLEELAQRTAAALPVLLLDGRNGLCSGWTDTAARIDLGFSEITVSLECIKATCGNILVEVAGPSIRQ